MPDLDKEFEAFVEIDKPTPGVSCWLCSAPERALIERERAKGRGYSQLHRFLKARYPDKPLSIHRVSNHFTGNHHVR